MKIFLYVSPTLSWSWMNHKNLGCDVPSVLFKDKFADKWKNILGGKIQMAKIKVILPSKNILKLGMGFFYLQKSTKVNYPIRIDF
jgi:hypothetical protein